MPLCLGVLGAGQAGLRHIAGFRALPDIRIAAVADADPQRARHAAAQVDAVPYGDWRQVLENHPELEAVVVALPHHMHAEPACMAAAQGLHVLMEKPIATTMADGRRIAEACRQAGAMLMIGYVHRFREEAVRAREWIGNGCIGTPVSCIASIASPRGAHLGAWVNAPETAGGGVLLYTGIHALDRLLWLVDAPLKRVHAATRTLRPSARVEEAVLALLEFANGTMASLAVHGPEYPGGVTGWHTEIYGTEGVVRINARQSVEIAGLHLEETIATHQFAAQAGEHYNFVRQARAFAEAIRYGLPSPVPGSEGLSTLEACSLIYRHARNGAA